MPSFNNHSSQISTQYYEQQALTTQVSNNEFVLETLMFKDEEDVQRMFIKMEIIYAHTKVLEKHYRSN